MRACMRDGVYGRHAKTVHDRAFLRYDIESVVNVLPGAGNSYICMQIHSRVILMRIAPIKLSIAE